MKTRGYFYFKFMLTACTLILLLSSSCSPKRVAQEPKTIADDTTYFGEYRYLYALDGTCVNSIKSRLQVIPSDAIQMQPFSYLKLRDRRSILNLMRLANVQLYGHDTAIKYYANYSQKKDGVIYLYIHPQAIYGYLPVENILAFNALEELRAPLCPENIRKVVTLPKLESLEVTVLNDKPYTIDLSGLDMSHIKNLIIHGLNCEQVIFPENNGIKFLGLSNCDMTFMDSSFQNLKLLNSVYFENTFIEKLDIKGLNKLDTINIAPAKGHSISRESIKNKKATTFIKIHESYFLPGVRTMYRDEAKQDTLYQKLAAAAGCK